MVIKSKKIMLVLGIGMVTGLQCMERESHRLYIPFYGPRLISLYRRQKAEVERREKIREKIEKRLAQVDGNLNECLDSIHDAPLLEAARYKELNDLLRILLERGANPNILHPYMDYSSLHQTCTEFGEPNREGALLLLRYGANPNIVPKIPSIVTPLINAIKQGSRDMVKVLLEHTADPNLRDYYEGNTPLIHALIKMDKKPVYLDIIKLLLYHGANPFIKNKKGESAIDSAKGNKQVLELIKNAKKILIERLTALLSRGQTPFNADIAYLIAQYRYGWPDLNLLTERKTLAVA